jgi:hypothetical protein
MSGQRIDKYVNLLSSPYYLSTPGCQLYESVPSELTVSQISTSSSPSHTSFDQVKPSHPHHIRKEQAVKVRIKRTLSLEQEVR